MSLVLTAKNSNCQALAPGFYYLQNDTFNYTLVVPVNSHPQQKCPLVMYLHGYSSQVDLPWFNDEAQQREPCFIFCPQCDDALGESAWGGTYDLGQRAYPDDLRPPMASALSIIDSLKKIYPIDTNRIIVYGGSMGAEGVFMLLAKKPTMFAGAVAVAGYTLTVGADQMAQTPLWILHGGSDQFWDGSQEFDLTQSSRDIYAAILGVGGKRVRYTEYPGLDHQSIWGQVEQQTDIITFMLAQNKNIIHIAPDPVKNLTCRLVNAIPTLFWDTPSDTSSADKRIWYYRIFRNNQLVVTQDNNLYSQVDTTAPPNSGDTYKMTAVNITFNESALSDSVVLTTGVNPLENKTILQPFSAHISMKPGGSRIVVTLTVKNAGLYSVLIYSSNGKMVHGEKSRYYTPGCHCISWNAYGAACGLFIAKIRTPSFDKNIRFFLK
jgi:dienelactone hydrolase